MHTRNTARSLVTFFALAGLSLGLAACGGGGDDSKDAAKASAKAAGPDGSALFVTNCAVCHGDTGTGDGIGAAGLVIKPRNLTTEAYKYVDIAGHASELDALIAYIKIGKPENGMPPYGHMKEADIKAMAEFVASVRPKPNFVEE